MALEEKLLDNLALAYPCPIKWEAMDGEERARICSQCSQHVYNISDMTTIEAENCPKVLRPIRNFATCLNRATSLALSVVLSTLLSACNNSWPQSILDAGIFQIKENLQMDVDGRPAPSQTRDTIKKVSFDARFYASKELSNQLDLEVKNRGIHLSTLEKLSDYYAQNQLPCQQFVVEQLKELVKRKTPGTHSPFDAEKFENLRKAALDKILDDTEKLIANKKWTQASVSSSDFTYIAWLSIEDNNTSPARPYMSALTLDRAIKIYKAMDKVLCGANMTLLDLETAKQLSSATAEERSSIIKAAQKKYYILRQINYNLAHPYVVAELENLVPDKNFRLDTFIASYRVIDDPSKTIFGDRFQMPLYLHPKSLPSGKLPSIGSKHFLLLERNTANKTYSLRGPDYMPIDYESWVVEKYKFENEKAMTIHEI